MRVEEKDNCKNPTAKRQDSLEARPREQAPEPILDGYWLSASNWHRVRTRTVARSSDWRFRPWSSPLIRTGQCQTPNLALQRTLVDRKFAARETPKRGTPLAQDNVEKSQKLLACSSSQRVREVSGSRSKVFCCGHTESRIRAEDTENPWNTFCSTSCRTEGPSCEERHKRESIKQFSDPTEKVLFALGTDFPRRIPDSSHRLFCHVRLDGHYLSPFTRDK